MEQPKRALLMRVTRENVAFLGASLAVLGQGGSPPGSKMGDKVCLDTVEMGRHDREIAYEILLGGSPTGMNTYLPTQLVS